MLYWYFRDENLHMNKFSVGYVMIPYVIAMYFRAIISKYYSSQSMGKWKRVNLVVSSLRMDAVAAKGLGIARKYVCQII